MAMLDPPQFSLAVDRHPVAIERALQRAHLQAGKTLVDRLVPSPGEIIGALGIEQAVGGARGHADGASGASHATAAGEGGNEPALPHLGPAVAAPAQAGDGSEGDIGQLAAGIVRDRAGGEGVREFWFAHGAQDNRFGYH